MSLLLESIKKTAERRGLRWSHPAGVEGEGFITFHFPKGPVTVQKTRTPFMSAVALKISTDKYLTARLLGQAGLPVLPQRLCETVGPEDERFLAEHGRLVVKPNTGDRSVGVDVGVRDAEGLRAAVARARSFFKGPALLQPLYRGRELRLVTIGGRFIGGYESLPARLTGDGRSTAAELLAAFNAEPRRLKRLDLDEGLLAEQGLRASSVPAAGESFRISDAANVYHGGEPEDRTDELHPDLARAAEKAAAAVGVDVAGVDFLVKDPAAPLRGPEDGIILEVNSMPGMHGFLHGSGRKRPVLDAYLDYLESKT